MTRASGLAENREGLAEACEPAPSAPARLKVAQFLLDVIGRCEPSDVADLLSPQVVFELVEPGAAIERTSGRDAVFRELAQLANRMWLATGDGWEDWLIGERHVAALGSAQDRGPDLVDPVCEEVLFTFDPSDVVTSVRVNLRSCA